MPGADGWIRRSRAALALFAGLMGASGVGLAAAGAHRGGGEDVRIASDFLLIHAVAILGAVAMSQAARRPGTWIVASAVLGMGSVAFSGDLALIGLASLRPLPMAAPIGGVGLMAGWLAIAYAATTGIMRDD